MFIKVNPNPMKKNVGDCSVRAICLSEQITWDKAFLELCTMAAVEKDMPSSNEVIDKYLLSLGYKKGVIYNTCPDCYTIEKFCLDHKTGTYIVATGTHVVCVNDGNYLDTWDSGDKVAIYYYEKRY